MGYLDSYYVSESVDSPFVRIIGNYDELKNVIEGQDYLRWIKIKNTMGEDALKAAINEAYPGSSVDIYKSYSLSHIQGIILEREHKHEYEEFLTQEEKEEMMNNTGLIEEIEHSSYPHDLFKSMKNVINKYFEENGQENIKISNHASLLVDLSGIYIDRNRKYGDSFSQNFEDFGMVYPVSRIGEKYNRLKGIVKDKEIVEYADESLEDTLLDIANYSILTAIELRNGRHVPIDNDTIYWYSDNMKEKGKTNDEVY